MKKATFHYSNYYDNVNYGQTERNITLAYFVCAVLCTGFGITALGVARNIVEGENALVIAYVVTALCFGAAIAFALATINRLVRYGGHKHYHSTRL